MNWFTSHAPFAREPLLGMLGMPDGTRGRGPMNSDVAASVFRGLIQPTLGALPWNRGYSVSSWVAFPQPDDPRFAVKES